MDELRRPVLDRSVAMRLAAVEYRRFTEQLSRLRPDEWSTPTTCPGWDVRAMATHSLGMAEMVATPWETFRQLRAARSRGGVFIDALTGLQVEEHAAMTPEQIVARFEKVGPRAARGRRLTPGPLRKRVLPKEETDLVDPWTVGFLFDVILTRDTWMHRMDIAAATGREPELTSDHDGVLVADAAQEWARRHGEGCRLTLTGPAGGAWTFGTGGPTLELDAVEFCRILSGREAGQGLLQTAVPF